MSENDVEEIFDDYNIGFIEDIKMYYCIGEEDIICIIEQYPGIPESEFAMIEGLGIYVATGQCGYSYAGYIDGSAGEFEDWMHDYYLWDEEESLKRNMNKAVFNYGVDSDCDIVYEKLLDKLEIYYED